MSTFPGIRIEGGLLGPDTLDQILAGELPGQKPSDFGLDGRRTLTDEIASVFADARVQWEVFQRRLARLPESDPGTSVTRDAWMIPFLSLLGYELRYNPRAYEVDGATFAISHRAGEAEDAPPVHIVGGRQELGRVAPSGRPRLSPHALVQEFLNRSEHLWGIVTNGRVLRLLRKSTEVRRQSYVEFDLEAIFGQNRFEDFVLLYRLLHRTRLPRSVADAGECWLERYYQDAREQGNRARDRLRDGVEKCLKLLGAGFLRHWRGELPDAKELYAQLLRLVYRFLFLLVAEERGLLGGNDLYREHYSVSRFRRLVDRRETYTDHEDLWLSLVVLWHLLRDSTPAPQADGRPLASLLGIPVLNGGLFEPLPLEQQTITNRELLEAFFHLVYYYDDDARTWRRINYAALDVEELGSVYESLLDNHPVVSGRTFDFGHGTCLLYTSPSPRGLGDVYKRQELSAGPRAHTTRPQSSWGSSSAQPWSPCWRSGSGMPERRRRKSGPSCPSVSSTPRVVPATSSWPPPEGWGWIWPGSARARRSPPPRRAGRPPGTLSPTASTPWTRTPWPWSCAR